MVICFYAFFLRIGFPCLIQDYAATTKRNLSSTKQSRVPVLTIAVTHIQSELSNLDLTRLYVSFLENYLRVNLFV